MDAMKRSQRKLGWMTVALVVGCFCLLGVAIWMELTSPKGTEGQVEPSLAAKKKEASELLLQGKLDQAGPAVEQLVKVAPGDSEVQRLMAEVRMQEAAQQPAKSAEHRKKSLEALDHARRSLELKPAQPEVHELAGNLAFGMEDYEAARHHYFKASELDPKNPRPPLFLAQVMIKINDLPNAGLQLARSLNLDANNPVAYATRADLFAKQGDKAMALDQIGKAIELGGAKHPKAVYFSISKAKILKQFNEPAAALALLSGLPAEKNKEGLIVRELADCHLMMSKPAFAGDVWAGYFEEIGQKLGNSSEISAAAEAAAKAGQCYLRAGDRVKARYYKIMADRIDREHFEAKALAESMLRTAEVK